MELDAGQELYQRLLAQPTVAIPLNAEAVSRQLVSGPCLYYHHNLLEPNGAVTTFDLRDGTDANGGLVAAFSLAANGSRALAPTSDPGFIETGLFLAVTAGAISGVVYVKHLDHDFDVETYQQLLAAPTRAIPIPVSSVARLVCSGPCLLVGVSLLETAGAVVQVRFRDGLNPSGTEVAPFRINANGLRLDWAQQEYVLCRRGLFLDFNAGQLRGAVFVKTLDGQPVDPAYAELVDSPVVAIPLVAQGGAKVLVSGPCILTAVFVTSQAGVTTTGDLLDGLDANGVEAIPIRLASGAPIQAPLGGDGLYCPRGLFLNLTVGSLDGAVWVRLLGRDQERELYQALADQPATYIPLNVEASNRLLASGPLLFLGFGAMTSGVVTGWRFKDGLDDNGSQVGSRPGQVANSAVGMGTVDGAVLLRSGLWLSMVTGALTGGAYIKAFGREYLRELFDLLNAQPAQILDLDGVSASQVLVSGPCIVCDTHLMVSGAVNLIFDLLDGLDANGQRILSANVGLSGAVDLSQARYTALAQTGLFVKFTSGTMRGSFRVKVLNPLQIQA